MSTLTIIIVLDRGRNIELFWTYEMESELIGLFESYRYMSVEDNFPGILKSRDKKQMTTNELTLAMQITRKYCHGQFNFAIIL